MLFSQPYSKSSDQQNLVPFVPTPIHHLPVAGPIFLDINRGDETSNHPEVKEHDLEVKVDFHPLLGRKRQARAKIADDWPKYKHSSCFRGYFFRRWGKTSMMNAAGDCDSERAEAPWTGDSFGHLIIRIVDTFSVLPPNWPEKESPPRSGSLIIIGWWFIKSWGIELSLPHAYENIAHFDDKQQ